MKRIFAHTGIGVGMFILAFCLGDESQPGIELRQSPLPTLLAIGLIGAYGAHYAHFTKNWKNFTKDAYGMALMIVLGMTNLVLAGHTDLGLVGDGWHSTYSVAMACIYGILTFIGGLLIGGILLQILNELGE